MDERGKMDKSNDFLKQLAMQVGETKGILTNLLPQIKRSLDRQEEAFKRLGDIETNCAKRTTRFEEFKKKADSRSGKISGLISGIVNTIFIAVRIFIWGEK